MTCHHFRPARPTVFIEDLVQYGLLLDSVDLVWRLGGHEEALLLLADQAVVGRLRQLLLDVVVLHARAAAGRLVAIVIVYLLQEVVLLVAHHDEVRIATAVPTTIGATAACVFLALLELIFERLGIDAYTTIADDLLARVARYATVDPAACSAK